MLTTNELSSQLALSDALHLGTSQELIAGGSGQFGRGGAVRVSVHRFTVSSQDALTEVRVFLTGGLGGKVHAVLRPPGGASLTHTLMRKLLLQHKHGRSGGYPLTRGDDGTLTWARGDRKAPPGVWELEVRWERQGMLLLETSLTWAYQVWATSSLCLDLDLSQLLRPGKALQAAARVRGQGVSQLRWEAFVNPPGAALDNLIAHAYGDPATAPRLTQAMKGSLKALWPETPERPWWRLRQSDKLAALLEIGLPIPELRLPRQHLACTPDAKDPAACRVSLAGSATTVQGVYHVLVRVTGSCGAGPGAVFERVAYRQVFAIPAPSRKHTIMAATLISGPNIGARAVVAVSMRDAHGNVVLIAPGDPIAVQLAAGGRTLQSTARVRFDGTIAVELDEDLDEGRESLAVALNLRGAAFGAYDLPLPNAAALDFVPMINTKRFDSKFLREALQTSQADTNLRLRAGEHLLIRPDAGPARRWVSIFVVGVAAAPRYQVEFLRPGHDPQTLGEGQGSRRFALPPGISADTEIRVTPLSFPRNNEAEFLGIRLD